MSSIDASVGFDIPKDIESDGNGNFLARHWKGLTGLVGSIALLGGAVYVGTEIQARRDKAEIAQAMREKDTALALTAAGFGNVVSVTTEANQMVAELTSDACDDPVAFVVEGPNDEGGIRVVLPQRDVRGEVYDTATAMNGEQAQELMADLCNE
jgi:hypothetical protein